LEAAGHIHLNNLYITLRNIKTYIKKEDDIKEDNIIDKHAFIVLLSKEEYYSAYHNILLYKFNMLYKNKVHVVSGHCDSEIDKIIIEDTWEYVKFIRDFENEEYYYWENTLQKIA
jgi:hypothetical protein